MAHRKESFDEQLVSICSVLCLHDEIICAIVKERKCSHASSVSVHQFKYKAYCRVGGWHPCDTPSRVLAAKVCSILLERKTFRVRNYDRPRIPVLFNEYCTMTRCFAFAEKTNVHRYSPPVDGEHSAAAQSSDVTHINI